MTRGPRFALATALAAVVVLAGCSRTGPHERMIVELADAYRPYRDCIVEALKVRPDFVGRLGAMVVAKDLDGRVRDIRSRYLGAPDAAAAPLADDAAAVDADLAALAAFAAAQPPGTPFDADAVRRQMAMVETLEVTALATGVSCDYPKNLTFWMEEAANEYL